MTEYVQRALADPTAQITYECQHVDEWACMQRTCGAIVDIQDLSAHTHSHRDDVISVWASEALYREAVEKKIRAAAIKNWDPRGVSRA